MRFFKKAIYDTLYWSFGEIVVWTTAKQYMSVLLLGFGVLSMDTSTRSLVGLGIEPLTILSQSIKQFYLFILICIDPTQLKQ